MNMILEKDVVSLTDFARQTRKHTAELKKHNRPRVLTHNGKATAVVLSVSAFDKLMHAAEEYRLDMELKSAVEAYAEGKRGTPGPQAFQEIRAAIAKRRASK
jgi:PHD/YefM family antitoxin component YafN of YafNO toxin-antitoxin module